MKRILSYRPMAPSVMTRNNQIPYMDFVGPANTSDWPKVVSTLVHRLRLSHNIGLT